MRFTPGELFQIEMRNGIYQVLALYKTAEDGDVYIFRKVFDGKLVFKPSKAETVHESWMTPLGEKTKKKLEESLCLTEVQSFLTDLTVDKKLEFLCSPQVEITACVIDPKKKSKIEKRLREGINGFVDPFALRNAIRTLAAEGELEIAQGLTYPEEGKRLYRLELGRFFDDFDEYGSEVFRDLRFVEVKVYRRADFK